jgi:glycosyltransferase involved in cell wall biosynthesis
MKKRILMICPFPFLQDRGSPLLVYNCATALSEFGYKIDLLCFPLGRDPQITNVRVHPVLRFTSHIPIGLSWAKPVYDFLLLLKALGFRLKKQYDIVHGQHIEGTLIGLIVKGRLPLYYTIHSLLSEEMKITKVAGAGALQKVFELFESITYKAADKIFPVSPSFVEIVGKYSNKNKCYFIPDVGPESQANPGITEKIRADFPDKVKFMYTGNLTVYQGIDLLIEAFKGIDAHLIIVGGTEDVVGKYRQLARELEVQNVHFLGQQPAGDIPSYLAAADVLVSPRLEGSNIPSKLFTYITMKKPVILTDIPAHTQLEKEAFLFCKPTPEDLANKMQMMLDEKTRLAYQQKICEISKHFTRDAYKEKLAAVY